MRRYRFMAGLGVAAAVGAAAGLLSGGAGAKEKTAGCPGFPRAFSRIEHAIALGAPTWNEGNQLATYATYRDVTREILDDLVTETGCGQLRSSLMDGLERAHKAQTPGTAGWDLRHGFDTFLDYAGRGDSPKIYAPQVVEETRAPFYGKECGKLFAYVQRGEQALAQGRAAKEAKAIIADAKQSGQCENVAAALTAGMRKHEAEAALERVVDGQPPPGDADEPAPIVRRCTLIPALVEEIGFAIERGVPRFEDGRADLCLTIYQAAAKQIVERYGKSGRCAEAVAMLKKGLAEAKQESDVSKAAWALRHAFDAVLEAFARALPH